VTAGNQLFRAGGARRFHGKVGECSGQDNKLSFRLPFSFCVTAFARRQLVADTLQELGYLLDEQAGEALGALTEAQLQHVRVKGAGLNVRKLTLFS